MRSEELESATRMASFIGDAANYTEYTQAKVLNELNDALQTKFEDVVVKARSGYWLKEYIYTATSGQARFRIPPRSVVGGLEKVEVATGTGQPFSKLTEIPASVEQDYVTQNPGTPDLFWVSGDVVEIIPAATSGMLVKLSYYIRPSRLVPSQSDPNGTVRGRITAINTGTRVVTVNAIPFDQSLTSPAAMTSGVQSIDIVHPDGWHELALVGASQTFSGLNITVGGSDPLTDAAVGDFVRVADQTDWPCIPDDFDRTLADLAAVTILRELHLLEKAEATLLAAGLDLARLRSLLVPRVKTEPKEIPIMRRSRGGFGPGWRWGS